MIEPNPWDINRAVIYRPNTQHVWGGYKSPDQFVQEEGVLAGIDKDNVDMVLVKFPTKRGYSEPIKVKAELLSWKDEGS